MAMLNTVVGAVVRVNLKIKNMAGVVADPTALRIRVKDPDGDETIYTYGSHAEVVKDAIGQYHADLVMGQAGNWFYRWEGDTDNAGAAEGVIKVKRSLMT